MRLDRLLLTVGLLAGTVLVAAPAGADDDTLPPTITINSPTGDDLLRGDSISVDYSCVDETDPAPTCEGQLGGIESPYQPIASGDGFTFLTVDTYQLQVTSQDASGNANQSTVQIVVTDRMCDGHVVTVIRDAFEDPTNGPDVIEGTSARIEVIDGLGGADRICAGGSTTVINGGPGNDRIFGSPTVDRLEGGSGNDRIEGGAGADRIEGDEGNDTLLGGTEVDRLEGGTGNDSINGGAARDTCLGQDGTRDTKAQCEVAVGFP